jgi:hypothetical protein
MKLKLFFLVVVGLLVTGCVPWHVKHTNEIQVGRPLIFSRESLLIDRQKELNWLTGKRDMPITHGVQGKRFTRDFTSLIATAKIQADPTVIGKYKAQQELDLDNIERLSELTKKNHERMLANEDAELDLLNRKSLAYATYLNNVSELHTLKADIIREEINALKDKKKSSVETILTQMNAPKRRERI